MTTTAESDRRERNARHRASHPRTMIPPEASALRVLSTSNHNGLALVVGETTAVAGLLLTPFAGGTPLRYTGLWCLTHAASGLKVTQPASLPHTHEAAEWLRRTGLDWNRPADVCQADTEIEAAFLDLSNLMFAARRDGHPLLYARTSWVPWPPQWRIRHRSLVSTAGYPTWASAAALADYACTRPAGELHLHPDAEIVRDADSPGWALRCASIACSDRSWLIDWFNDESQALGTHADLSDLAVEEGWRAHPGDRWTCTECTRNYR
jgi:hypothetical protein